MLNSAFVRTQSLILARNLLSPEFRDDAARIREAYARTIGRDPAPEEIRQAKSFLARYTTLWRKAHPAPPQGAARPSIANQISGVTVGIARSDGLTQDDEILEVTAHGEDPSLAIEPASAAHAAWGALVQSLYGSAAFQFVL